MYVAKRGKTAPAKERKNVLAAMADAALGGLTAFSDDLKIGGEIVEE